MGQRIDVNHLNIFYGDFLAVEDVNINIEANKVTAFIGPSGCGKSTVLRTLDRMHEIIPGAHCEGEVLLEGKNLYDKDVDPVAVRRDVGMVFQRPNPFPTMSIRENVLAGVKLNNRKISKSDADDLVEWALRGANLWNEVKDRLDNPGIGLSGGQQQRLCIARAVAVHPQVLLMDEPCSALDPISTLAVEDLINELKNEYTIVIVTHNMQQAARIADYTAFFNLKAVASRVTSSTSPTRPPCSTTPRTKKPSATYRDALADRQKPICQSVALTQWVTQASFSEQQIMFRFAKLLNCTRLIGKAGPPKRSIGPGDALSKQSSGLFVGGARCDSIEAGNSALPWQGSFPASLHALIGKSSLTPACGGLSHGCAVESGCFANHFDPIRGGHSPEREFFVCDT